MPVELRLVCEVWAVVGAGVVVRRGCIAPCHGEHSRIMLSLPSQSLRSFPFCLFLSSWSEIRDGEFDICLSSCSVPTSLPYCLQYFPR